MPPGLVDLTILMRVVLAMWSSDIPWLGALSPPGLSGRPEAIF